MEKNKLLVCICLFEPICRKRFLSLAIVLVCFFSAHSQNDKSITGTVVSSSDNTPIPGVNVLVKDSNNGTVTDFDGNFIINASNNDILVFSYLGFETREVTLDGQNTLNVSLVEEASSLDEVVVVGYGTQRKSDLTGAVSTVNTEEITKQATNDVTQMLQGRVAGVSITTDGQPGASPNVRIRGVATFGLGSSAEPLYVVDGFPISGGIRDINPNDIKSIQVLKDATAGAIYGNRAANGVIIVETKSGVKGKPFSVEINSYYGIQQITQSLPVLDRVGYQMINNELLANANQPPVPGNDPNSELFIDNIDTDWQNAGYKDGFILNHNFNISGGSEKTSYFVSLDYLNNEGTLVGSGPDYKRYSFRVNSETELGKFKFGENIYLVRSDENPLFSTTTISLPGTRPSLVNDLLQAAPTIPLYDPNRLGGFGGADSNIHQSITLNVPGINTLIENSTRVNRILANFYASFEPVKGLTLKTNLQYDNTSVEDELFVPQYDLGYFFPNPVASLQYGSRNSNSFLLENTINWTKEFGKHNLTILAGQTYQEFGFREVRSIGSGLTEPYVRNLENADTFSVTDNQQPSSISSLLGRINYSFDDKY
ncbi:MAG: SusC/RagA family TonB-linked outer membrane protein, partial [Leeuwenhoekiella sp.]